MDEERWKLSFLLNDATVHCVRIGHVSHTTFKEARELLFNAFLFVRHVGVSFQGGQDELVQLLDTIKTRGEILWNEKGDPEFYDKNLFYKASVYECHGNFTAERILLNRRACRLSVQRLTRDATHQTLLHGWTGKVGKDCVTLILSFLFWADRSREDTKHKRLKL
jgi:hypothetical protein